MDVSAAMDGGSGVSAAGSRCARSASGPTAQTWLEAAGGALPAGAIAYGREADGREQFACRGAYGGGTHLGKITAGFSGCNIGYGGREVTLPNYEVLAQPRVRSM